MKTLIQRLLKDSIIYGMGGALAKGITFLMLPFYTRIFSLSDYGVIELLTILGFLLEAIVGMGMDSAQSFYFFKEKYNGPQSQNRVVSAILQWRLTWGVGLFAILLGAKVFVSRFGYLTTVTDFWFFLFCLGTWFTLGKSQATEVCRLQFRPWPYIFVHTSNAAVTSLLTIVFALIFKLGLLSFILGYLLGNLFSFIHGMWIIREHLDFSQLHTQWWTPLLKFGLPLVPAAIGLYYLSFSDRWLIGYFLGSDSLGIYSAGAKFALAISLVVSTFRQAWWPFAMELINKPEGPAVLRVVSKYYLGLGAIACLILTLLSGPILRALVPEAYFGAQPLIGILCWGSILYGYFMVIGMGIWKAEKTYLTTINLLVAATAGVGAQFYLIPKWGLYGAAIPSVLSFLLWNILTVWWSERLWKVGFPIGTLAIQLVAGMTGTGLILHTINSGDYSFTATAMIALVAVSIQLLTLMGSNPHYILDRLGLRLKNA